MHFSTKMVTVYLIGVSELRPLLEHLGHEVSEERLQEVMKKFDVNGDGELCKKEVRAMVDELKELVRESILRLQGSPFFSSIFILFSTRVALYDTKPKKARLFQQYGLFKQTQLVFLKSKVLTMIKMRFIDFIT